jgi:hypothetical protein
MRNKRREKGENKEWKCEKPQDTFIAVIFMLQKVNEEKSEIKSHKNIFSILFHPQLYDVKKMARDCLRKIL